MRDMQGQLRRLGSAASCQATGPPQVETSAQGDQWQPLWADRFLLVVEKGPDLLSTPGKTSPDCLISRVTMQPEFARARIVHRLVRRPFTITETGSDPCLAGAVSNLSIKVHHE